MKGRSIIIDRIGERSAAALIVDGRLQDLLIDPVASPRPLPGAIYRAIADRPIKGQNGIMLKLGEGQTGFLRQAKGVAPGQVMLVQVATHVEGDKAAPVSTRLLFKGRYAILTPDAPGRNVARSVRDEDERVRLSEIADRAMDGAVDTLGLILRSAATGTEAAAIEQEIAALRQTCEDILSEVQNTGPALLLEAPTAEFTAWRDWTDPDPDEVVNGDNTFAEHGVWDMIDDLRQPKVTLGPDAFMYVEPTRALVAVDVNTGGDFSFAAGLKANMAAVRELPRQLRLRGLGGQITLDLAPMGKKDRLALEQVLKRALKNDRTETSFVGWTPLGHLELQRKRERIPLQELLAGIS